MNEQDLNTLKQFAKMALDYLGEDELYDTTQLWQHLENCVKLKRKMRRIVPAVQTIIETDEQPNNIAL